MLASNKDPMLIFLTFLGSYFVHIRMYLYPKPYKLIKYMIDTYYWKENLTKINKSIQKIGVKLVHMFV